VLRSRSPRTSPVDATTPRPAGAHRAAAALGAVLAVGALAGCAAGRYNQQFKERASITEVEGRVGGIAVGGAYWVAGAPVGGAATLYFTLATIADQGDTLASVTSPVAAAPALTLGRRASGAATFASISTADVPVTTMPFLPLYSATATSVTTALQPSATYPVIFTFQRGGSLTLQVPVLREGAVPAGSTGPAAVLPNTPYPTGTP